MPSPPSPPPLILPIMRSRRSSSDAAESADVRVHWSALVVAVVACVGLGYVCYLLASDLFTEPAAVNGRGSYFAVSRIDERSEVFTDYKTGRAFLAVEGAGVTEIGDAEPGRVEIAIRDDGRLPIWNSWGDLFKSPEALYGETRIGGREAVNEETKRTLEELDRKLLEGIPKLPRSLTNPTDKTQ